MIRQIAGAAVAVSAVVILTSGVSTQGRQVFRIEVSGVIEMGLAPFVERSLREAEEAGAAAVVLDIETPGGRVDAAQRIVKAVTSAEIPVYALVNTHAWSAGAMIALAADSIFMVPGSSIGAATPVLGDGQKGSEKIVSAMRGEFRALAERRGLDPRLAEAMVDEDVEIPGVIERGKLLTLTPSEAITQGLAAAEVDGLAGMLDAVQLAGASVVTTEKNWAEQVVRFLSHPMVAPILLSLGTLGLIMEIKTPSFGVAGTVGLLSFGAFFGSHLLIGLAGWEEVILLGVGVVALALEVLVIPGFGIAGVVAILCIGSAIFLSLLGNIPTWDDFALASSILGGSVMLVGLGIAGMVRYLPQSTGMHGVFLAAATDREAGYISAPERLELVGMVGVASTDLRPAGTIKVGDERIDAVTQGEFIAKGTRVRIIRSEAYRHVVEAEEASA